MTFGLIPIEMRNLPDEPPPANAADVIGRQIMGWSWYDFLAGWDPVNNEAHALIVWKQLSRRHWDMTVQIGRDGQWHGNISENDDSKANDRYYQLRSSQLTWLICRAALCTLEPYEERYFKEFGEPYNPTEINWKTSRSV